MTRREQRGFISIVDIRANTGAHAHARAVNAARVEAEAAAAEVAKVPRVRVETPAPASKPMPEVPAFTGITATREPDGSRRFRLTV